LFAQATLMIPVLFIGLSVIPFISYELFGRPNIGAPTTEDVVIISFFAFVLTALVLLVAVGRFAQLRRTASRRWRNQGPLATPRGMAFPRRAAAQLIDLICVAAFAVALYVVLFRSLRPYLGLWFAICVVLSVAALLYYSVLAVGGRWLRGRTLGEGV